MFDNDMTIPERQWTDTRPGEKQAIHGGSGPSTHRADDDSNRRRGKPDMKKRIHDVRQEARCEALARPSNHTTPSGRILAALLALALSVIHASLAWADLTVNVDGRVDVSFTDMAVGQTVKTYSTEATVTNTSDSPILAPIRLVIFEIDEKNIIVSNADGFTTGGRPFIEIGLVGEVLAPDESSLTTVVEFRRRAGNSPALAQGKGKGKGLGTTKNRNFPTFEFSHSVQGGSTVSLSAPSSTPFALAAGVPAASVDFSVSAVTEGGIYGGDVFLQGPGLDNGLQMNDSDGDGIFLATVTVSADSLAGGDCLTYTASTVSGEGTLVESPTYNLCATSFRIGIGESNTLPGNQTSVSEGFAVGDELLVFVQPGTSESVIESIAKQIGGEVIGTLLPQGMYQFRLGSTLSEKQLRALVAEVNRVDGVTGSGPNFIGEFVGAPNDPEFTAQHALKLVSSDDPTVPAPKYVWDAGATGNGITVLVLDSGIDETHSDLTPLAALSPTDNIDTLGHGTEMAGIIGALTDNATGVAAMAREAKLRSINISEDNTVTEAEMMSGFTRADPLTGPNVVVNMSFAYFGLPLPTANLCSAIDGLIDNGSVVVNSAGNNNTSTTGVWPARCNDPALNGLLGANIIADTNKPSFIVVGASNCNSGSCTSDSKKSDSNFGSWVDIAAPGVGVRTTTISNTYTGSNGTSAAAALTSGGAAVLRSCGVTTTDVFDRLNGGATVMVTSDFNRMSLYHSLALPAVNAAPTAIGLSASTTSIDEFVDTTGGFVIGDLTTTDTTVCDAHAYSVTGGADMAAFSISGNQLLLDDGVLDFETQSSYTVEVTSTDFYGVATTETFVVTINDLPEPVIEELVSCGTDATSGDVGGDLIFRGFYHPAYPGTSIDQVELSISGRQAGDHTVRLDVKAGTYDGTLIAFDSQTRTLSGVDTDNVSYVFELGNAPVTSGSTVTFSLTLEAGPLSPLSDNQVYYAVDAAAHPFASTDDPASPCDINQTEGTSPLLDDLRRNGIWVRIDGLP